MIRYFTTVFRKRSFILQKLLLDLFVYRVLRESINHDAQTEQRKQKVDNARGIASRIEGVALFAHLICPIVGIDSAGNERKQECNSARSIVFSA